MAFIIALIVIGLLLLLAELTIIPGFGIAGIGGIAALVGAIVMSFSQYGNTVGFCVLFGTLVICGIAVYFILRYKTWRKLTLKQQIDQKATPSPADRGISLGMEGVSVTRLNPAGNGRFGDITLEVQSAQGLVQPKTPIRIMQIEGTRVFVVPIDSPNN